MSRARVWTSRGKFEHTEAFFKKMKGRKYLAKMEALGEKGVEALRQATPKDSGLTSESWSCKIVFHSYGVTITWDNSNVVQGKKPFNVALEIQYGHGKKGGGYVKGIDYINPALRPVFDEIAEEIWKVVQSS